MENKQDKIFANPIFWRSRSDNQPDFVRGQMSLNVREMIDFLQNPEYARYISEKGYMNFQLLRSKDMSKNYFVLDTWKPKTESTTTITEEEKKAIAYAQANPHGDIGYPTEDINPDDIPF